MVNIPSIYRRAGEIFASFSFTDAITGTAYQTLTGMSLDDDTKALLGTAIASTDQHTDQAVGSGSSNTKLDEYDFDITFNKALLVKGNLFVTETYEARNEGSANTCTVYTKVRVYHVSAAAAETEIGAQTTTDEIISETSSGNNAKQTSVKFAVAQTTFGVGSKLRVNVELWGRASTGSNYKARMYHSGLNTETGDEGQDSNFLVQVPFKVNI